MTANPLSSGNPLDSFDWLSPTAEIASLGGADGTRVRPGAPAAGIEAARRFESVLFTQMLQEMKKTVIDWNDEQDGPAEQVDAMFWSLLGQNLGEQGNLGLWQQLVTELGLGAASAPGSLMEEAL